MSILNFILHVNDLFDHQTPTG